MCQTKAPLPLIICSYMIRSDMEDSHRKKVTRAGISSRNMGVAQNVTTGAEGSVKHVKLIHFCRQRLDFVSCGPRLLLDPRVILVHHYMVTQEVRAELKISRHFRPVSPFNV
ncbi:hypothetical protein BDA96_05G241400 [Sorghum bicolor]|uniref:Uncharacterized protein n=1 Tax=Sorghum bicolor TaxID=4558 RepID=A0A921UGP9_SORBI|nr:hypothetical protein BDA96_05G241400 [Sorghum bicolor]